MLRRGPVWVGYLAGCAVVVAGYYVVSSAVAETVLYGVLGLSSVGATVYGVRRYRPQMAWAWYLMAFSRLLFSAGDITFAWQSTILHHDEFPSYPDVLYLACYPLLTVSLMGFVHARRPGKDRAGLLDALVLSTGAGMLVWVFLISPYVRAADLTTAARLVSLAYPVADLLVLAVVLRLTTGQGDKPVAYRLLVAGMVAMLAGDILFGLAQLTSGYSGGNVIDVTWLTMYALTGAAALHPSMVGITRRADDRPTPIAHLPRLVALAGASLMAPAVLAIQWVRGVPIDVPLIVAACASLFLLVIFRLHGLILVLASTLDTVEEQATHDQLTGLANRRLFQSTWQQALSSTPAVTALLYIDLDGFKPVNDSFGHDTGDAVLVAVAQRLRDAVRSNDVVARLGGDEFAVILPSTDDAQAALLARRIVDALDRPIAVGDGTVQVGASVGVVVAPPGADPETELRRADTAMYAAKAAGRGCAVAA